MRETGVPFGEVSFPKPERLVQAGFVGAAVGFAFGNPEALAGLAVVAQGFKGACLKKEQK